MVKVQITLRNLSAYPAFIFEKRMCMEEDLTLRRQYLGLSLLTRSGSSGKSRCFLNVLMSQTVHKNTNHN